MRSKLLAVLLAGVFMLSPLVSSAQATQSAAELPHYFPEGVIQTTDSLEQMEEYLRYTNAMNLCYNASPNSNAFMLGEDDIRVETDLVSTSSYTENPAKMTIVLDQYRRMPDGRVRVTEMCDQYYITEAEFQVVVDDLVAATRRAAELNQSYYGELTDLIVESIASTLGVSPKQVRTQLDERVPGTDFTFREYWFVPAPSKTSDFIPRELHLGVAPAVKRGRVLGLTWLNTGVIYYTPMARVSDYLKGTPSVLQHELVHGNVNYQKFPFGDGLDLETGASLPEMLYADNKIDLFYHGYANVFRQLAEAYFSFPFDEVRDRVVRFDAAGNLWIDAEAYRMYFNQLEQIKQELQVAFKNTLAEYYSKQVWWLAMHQSLGQKDGVFKIMMAAQYDLTNVGGRDQTMHLLEVHRDEIMEAAEEAFEEQREPSRDVMPTLNIPPALVSFYESALPEGAREQLEEYFRNNPEQLERLVKSPDTALRFLETVLTEKGGS